MSYIKKTKDRRIFIAMRIEPEALEYIDLKAKRFTRGKKGGRSEAINRMVMFCKRYEEGLGIVEDGGDGNHG
jgi:hypothetical protein